MPVRRCQAGEAIVLREIVGRQVWSAKPVVVVRDSEDLLVTWLPPGTVWKKPWAPDGSEVTPYHRLAHRWWLGDAEWRGTGVLRLTIPGARYSVILFWTNGYASVSRWYINMEEPLERSSLGFDYLDQLLDCVVNRYRTAWRWRDEDEFEEAERIGLISKAIAQVIWDEAVRAVRLVMSGAPPFDDSWTEWRPEPGWGVPVLPAHWDRVSPAPGA